MIAIAEPTTSDIKIAELKAHLSATIKSVRLSGQEITICDRDTPVARLVPILENKPTQIIAASEPFQTIKSSLKINFDAAQGVIEDRGRR